MIFDKTVLIKQLTVVEAHGILLIRTDRGRIESDSVENKGNNDPYFND